jgi:hypothetical protein
MLKRIVVNYLAVYGLPTAVILVGFAVGQNSWFSPHSYGWLLLYLCLPVSLAVQLIRIVRSPMKLHAIANAAASFGLFVAVFVVLMELMPNYWPDWA